MLAYLEPRAAVLEVMGTRPRDEVEHCLARAILVLLVARLDS